MDMNLTVAIPITGVILMGNLVVNILRFVHIKKNGAETQMLIDIKEGQKNCHECFSKLNDTTIKSESHLGVIVQQLQTLNQNWRT